MTNFKYILLLFVIVIAMSACATSSLEVVQANHYNTLTKNMGKELLKRNLINNSKPWIELDYFEEEVNYAKVIFNKLPPTIIFGNDVDAKQYSSFASSISAQDKVRINNNSFTITSKNRTIVTNMIAKADWNADGKTDWIISCFVKIKGNPRTRDYTIIALDSQNAFNAYVVGVNECIGSICEQYQYDDAINNTYTTYNKSKPSTNAIKTLPGLKKITLPPSTSPKNKNIRNIGEKDLP